MFTSDQANTDPRNPANYADVKSVFYIPPAQLSEYETPDNAIDCWMDDEAKALAEAKRIAKAAGHRVVVEEHTAHEDGTHELVGSVTIFPWNV